MDQTQSLSIEQVNALGANEVARDTFAYAISFENLMPGASQTKAFNIQADSAFMVHNQTQRATIAGAAQTDSSRVVPIVNVMIIDTGTGRQLYAGEVPVSTQFGTAELPYILPRPKFFFARSTVSVQVTNVSSGTTYDRLDLVFNGEKIFFRGM